MIRLFNFETKKIMYVEDQTEADNLIDAGIAIELSLPELEDFEQQANELFDEYIAEVERIQNSDNPLHTDDVKAYEIDKLKQEYEEKSKEIESEYLKYRNKKIEESKVTTAQASIKVNEADKLIAEQFATRSLLELASAQNKGVALKQLADDISLLTNEQKTALQSHIMSVLSTVENDYFSEKQAIIAAVQDIRNSDLLAYEIAKQLPVSVKPLAQMHKEIAQQAVNEPDAFREGGIDRDFYEKHIKEASN